MKYVDSYDKDIEVIAGQWFAKAKERQKKNQLKEFKTKILSLLQFKIVLILK